MENPVGKLQGCYITEWMNYQLMKYFKIKRPGLWIMHTFQLHREVAQVFFWGSPPGSASLVCGSAGLEPCLSLVLFIPKAMNFLIGCVTSKEV